MYPTRSSLWLGLLAAALLLLVGAEGNAIQPHGVDKPQLQQERPIFDYRINGVKIDVKIVPAANDSYKADDGFPQFPIKEIGRCMIEFSLTCAQKRIARFLDVVGHLPEITLYGQSVKLVKIKELATDKMDERRTLVDVSEKIDQSIDDFFDTFALRITVPKRNGKKSQIDVMLDDSDVVEGRGDKGGGGCKGGKGGKKKKDSGGCKKMMMIMMMGLKAKMMGMLGMAMMKGMIMSGMSLMISKMMLLSKFMSSKGGMFGGFGGGGGDKSMLKEIVLLTKGGSSGGGGGGGGYSAPAPPPDSYGAPPPTGGGGGGGYDYSGGGGGGGWGRSFDHKPMTVIRDYTLDEPEHEQSVVTTREVDEPMELKLMPGEKWSRDATWSYTTESVVPDQMKASQTIEESSRRSKNIDQYNSLSRPIYAQGWKNYVAARNKNAEHYSNVRK